MVSTDNAAGDLEDFTVKYTFGVTPLQQYLVELPDGHVQALQIAWDTRSADDGGQRWYHLYPDEAITSEDPLHWTGREMNWNYMCAECHSTDLQKNYSLDSASFATTWSEINVGCEACHGPGGGFTQVMGDIYLKERPYEQQEVRRAGLRSIEPQLCLNCHDAKAPCIADDSPRLKVDSDSLRAGHGFHQHFPLKYRQP